MEIIKKENKSRFIDYSDNIYPNPNKQIHRLDFVFKDYKNEMFEIGWIINAIENDFIRVRITTTDIYEIKNREIKATENQIKQIIYESFQVAESQYNVEKISLSLSSQLKYSVDDEMIQILEELTRILLHIHESSIHDNHSHQHEK